MVTDKKKSPTGLNRRRMNILFMVGMTGFEPAASSSRTKRATKLCHIPATDSSIPQLALRCKYYFLKFVTTKDNASGLPGFFHRFHHVNGYGQLLLNTGIILLFVNPGKFL